MVDIKLKFRSDFFISDSLHSTEALLTTEITEPRDFGVPSLTDLRDWFYNKMNMNTSSTFVMVLSL